jgi:hypothetical protein
MQIDFPCTCGHNKISHIDVYQTMHSWTGESVRMVVGCYCEGCIDNSFCLGYKADNLRYLEQLNESR